MKKVFFAYQYGMANAGDFAINIGSLDLLENYYDDITIISKVTKNDVEYKDNIDYIKKYYPEFQVIEGPFNLNRGSLIKTLRSYIGGVVKYPYLLFKGEYKDAIKKSDIVFLNGGNILRCDSITDYIRLHALLFPLRLAKKSNIEYVLLPQSTTTINNNGKKLLSPFLNSAKMVFARENLSYEKLKEDFPNANIKDSLDSAFFIKNRELPKKEYEDKYSSLAKRKNNICITLRKEDLGDIGELNNEKKELIEREIPELANKALRDGYSLSFIIQTKKDKAFTEKIYDVLKTNREVSIIEEYDPLILREIYRNSSCLIGMRLHSMILAMSVGTPVVGYFDPNWGSKNPGTLGQFGMPFCFIEDRQDLYSMIEIAQSNKEKMISRITDSKNKVIKSLEEEV